MPKHADVRDYRVATGLESMIGHLYLKGADARRDRIGQQQLALEGQHSQNVQNGYYQAAQDWQTWGQTASNAALSYGSSQLLGGQVSAGEWAKSAPAGDVLGAMAKRTENEMFNPMMQPITGQGGLKTPGVTGPKTGGLKR